MRRDSDQEKFPIEKRGPNWSVHIMPAESLDLSSEILSSFPQHRVHIEQQQPLTLATGSGKKQDMGVVRISGWVLVPEEPALPSRVADFWRPNKQPLKGVYRANWARQALINAHGMSKDLSALTAGFQFSIKHPKFTGELLALTPSTIKEYQKIDTRADDLSHCRLVVTLATDNGEPRHIEYIIKTDVITNPKNLVFAFVSNSRSTREQGVPSLTEAALLWREGGEIWRKGENALEIFSGEV